MIREIRLDDKKEWELLYRGYADFYKVEMNDKILKTVWEWIHDKNHDVSALAYEQDNKIIGIAHYRKMPSPLRGKYIGFLDDLYVHPDHRGSGVVQSLFKELKSLADKKDWPYVRWITASDNHRARAVYDKISGTIDFVTYQMQSK